MNYEFGWIYWLLIVGFYPQTIC